jgi:two-component system chemotaxis sensor kinase CheA
MIDSANDFLRRLMETFSIEAAEHLSTISSLLIELEKTDDAQKRSRLIENAFREAHSLKGAARSVDLMEVETICHAIENVFAALKRNEIILSTELFDVLQKGVDSLGLSLASAQATKNRLQKVPVAAIIGRLDKAARGDSKAAVIQTSQARDERREYETERREEVAADTAVVAGTEGILETEYVVADASMAPQQSIYANQNVTETVRIAASKLDSLVRQAEELLSIKFAAKQQADDLREVNIKLELWNREWKKIYPEVRKARQLLNINAGGSGGISEVHFSGLLGFIEWNHSYMREIENRLAALAKSSVYDSYSLNLAVDNLLWDIKRAVMLPVSSLLELFPKVVRDISRDQGKNVDLVVHTKAEEVDKRVLEAMKDPLIHLVRNCIDHGIEKPEVRSSGNKKARGIISITVTMIDSGHVEIAVSDDGAGLDIGKIKASALKQGILSPEKTERLAEIEAQSLIFQSGVTTSPIVTDISGRGLGLAIVWESVQRIGGQISLETHPGAGTTFRLRLPTTLSTFRGVQVRLMEQTFIIPTISIDRVAKVNREDIKTVENRETIELDGQVVSLVQLIDVLGIPRKTATVKSAKDDRATRAEMVVVVSSAETRIAFTVDEVINEQEVMVKSLGKQLIRVPHIGGATILGTGAVVPILHVDDLIKTALQGDVAPAVSFESMSAAREKNVLVVEDSITARTLLKSILETAGYLVKTAVDGVDAYTILKTGDFDLVVSDVDMPRMNGFDLTLKIRSDKSLAELPVVLVTSLDSRHDREHGVDVGANAYIIKSSFDQSNLLEVVGRLI